MNAPTWALQPHSLLALAWPGLCELRLRNSDFFSGNLLNEALPRKAAWAACVCVDRLDDASAGDGPSGPCRAPGWRAAAVVNVKLRLALLSPFLRKAITRFFSVSKVGKAHLKNDKLTCPSSVCWTVNSELVFCHCHWFSFEVPPVQINSIEVFMNWKCQKTFHKTQVRFHVEVFCGQLLESHEHWHFVTKYWNNREN